jgi:hypothetical protein
MAEKNKENTTRSNAALLVASKLALPAASRKGWQGLLIKARIFRNKLRILRLEARYFLIQFGYFVRLRLLKSRYLGFEIGRFLHFLFMRFQLFAYGLDVPSNSRRFNPIKNELLDAIKVFCNCHK